MNLKETHWAIPQEGLTKMQKELMMIRMEALGMPIYYSTREHSPDGDNYDFHHFCSSGNEYGRILSRCAEDALEYKELCELHLTYDELMAELEKMIKDESE